MKNNNYIQYVGLYIWTYLAIGVMVPLIGQYMKVMDFSGVEIGMTTGIGTWVAIFATGFWGRIYDRAKKKPLVVMGLCVMSGLVALTLLPVKNHLLFMIMFGLMYFFQAAIMSLCDATILSTNHNFGSIRLWGAVGFALGVFIGAQLAQKIGLYFIFPAYGMCYTVSALLLLSIYWKNRDGLGNEKPLEEKKKSGYLDLVKNKKLFYLLLSAFFMCGTNVANNTFFGFLYIQSGGTLGGVGLAFLLMAGSEAPFMGWSRRLAQRFTLERLIPMAMALSVIRFGWYGTGPSNMLLLLTFFLQGAVNGIILVEFIRYIGKLVKPYQVGSAIAAYYAFSSNCSTILCQAAGGVILDKLGPTGIYTFFALMNLAGLIVYIVAGLHREHKQLRVN